MRLLLALIVGFLSFFYLAEILIRLSKYLKFLRVFGFINHTLVGIIFLILGLALTLIENYFLAPQPVVSLSALFLIGAGLGLATHHLLFKKYLLFEKLEKDFVLKHEGGFERFLEILPGALTWLALTSPIWLSFTLPFAVAYLILLADAYWLFSALRIGTLIFIGFKKMEWAKKQDWLKNLKDDYSGVWDKYYHLVMLPTYKEPLEVLAPAYSAILNSQYPKDKIILAVGFEQRDSLQKIADTQTYLKSKVEGHLKAVLTTTHPFGLPGEVPGQGSNKNWMIKHILPRLKEMGIKPEQVIVTTLDADFVIHPHFLTGILHKYLSTPEKERDKRTYTGVFLYHNNYWQAPTPMRLMSTGTSFWQLAEMVGSDKYMNFSSLSVNLKTLLDVGCWMPDKVSDDSGFYWQAYFHFKGDYKVIPHYLPISADTVQDATLFKTFQNQYLQVKRWAYGVEHIPFIVKQYFKQDRISFLDKTDKVLFKLWGDLKWGFLAVFVTFGGMLIPIVNPNFKESVVAINLPVVSSWMLTLAFLGLFVTIFIHEKTVPPRPKEWSFLKKTWSYIQWVLIPIIIVTISTLPAIDAQTSLMFGKKLEFRVTNKVRLEKE